MSLVIPSRRIASRCLFRTSLPIRSRTPASPQANPHLRFASSGGSKPSESNPILDEYRRKNPEAELTSAQMQQIQQQQMAANQQQKGDLGSASVFEDERRTRRQQEEAAEAEEQEGGGGGGRLEGGDGRTGALSTFPSSSSSSSSSSRRQQRSAGARPMPRRNSENMLRVLDPDPAGRERWERKKVIQLVRKGGRLSKTEVLKRTEREHLVRSHNIKTSVKKLGMLARQIAGKTIDDAITQMRFSKKKAAVEVLRQLEAARDEAVVMRGMGLGAVGREDDDQDGDVLDVSATSGGRALGSSSSSSTAGALGIQLKDGKFHTVDDDSKIYIDQAWVGRGPYGKAPDYRARGRVYVMHTPWTSISVLLKEEKTRVREWQEREEARRRQRANKVWVHLPDRPIQPKHQWYSW